MPSPTRFLLASDNYPAALPPVSSAVDSDAVVVLTFLICALICVLGLALVARCAWIRGSFPATPPSVTLPNRGLRKIIFKSLPKISFDKTVHGRFVDCAICLAEFADGDEIRELPLCGHGFHVGCIDKWLESQSSCPSCRQIFAVATCQKCGGVPGTETEEEVKARESDGIRSLP